MRPWVQEERNRARDGKDRSRDRAWKPYKVHFNCLTSSKWLRIGSGGAAVVAAMIETGVIYAVDMLKPLILNPI